MATTLEELGALMIKPREVEGLEFKEAKTQYDSTKLFKYCVAIANEGGGKLILGVTDELPRKVVGTQAINDPPGMEKQILDKLRFRVTIEDLDHPDGRVVVCNIPSRPFGTAYAYEGAYLMRLDENLVPMTEDRLRQIFDEGKPDWLEVHSRTGLNAQEVIALLDTQKFFELLGIEYPSEREGVIGRLVSERLVDANDDGLNIRRLGALLLAKKLQEFPDLSRKAPRVVVYTGGSKVETKLDQPGTMGYAVGFQGLVKFVMSQLPQNEAIKDALRTEVKLLPEIVIREVTANALIHQDFTLEGMGVMIEVYNNRVTFSNPGEPVVPVDRFIDGYRSRNERLADLMRRFGICEEKSSGIDKVVHAAEVFQLPAPDFQAGFQRTEVVIYGLRSFEEMDRTDRIRACYQHAALKFVMREQMTNQSLRDRFHLPEAKSAIVSQIIAATLDAGLIKTDERSGGSRKFARYVPFWA
ncbi:MAG: putative DNA binding domain-containing protein [Blastocatellia bacterium]|nr:putative DNA binding domain-containing protein [Blastocatellia bacterium]